MDKLVYQYDDNGYFMYETVADESPLEPGIFLYPRNTTDCPPPNCNDKFIPRWLDNKWVLEEINQTTPLKKLLDFFQDNPDVWHLINSRINNKYDI